MRQLLPTRQQNRRLCLRFFQFSIYLIFKPQGIRASLNHLTISLVTSCYPGLIHHCQINHQYPTAPRSYIQTHAQVVYVYSVGAVSSSYSLSALVLMLDGDPDPRIRVCRSKINR